MEKHLFASWFLMRKRGFSFTEDNVDAGWVGAITSPYLRLDDLVRAFSKYVLRRRGSPEDKLP